MFITVNISSSWHLLVKYIREKVNFFVFNVYVLEAEKGGFKFDKFLLCEFTLVGHDKMHLWTKLYWHELWCSNGVLYF